MPILINNKKSDNTEIIDTINAQVKLCIQNYKKCPYLKKKPSESMINNIDVVTNRYSDLYEYEETFGDNKNTELYINLRKRYTKNASFVTFFFMYDSEHSTASQKHVPFIQRYTKTLLVKDKNIDVILDNIKNIVGPGHILTFISKNPKVQSLKNYFEKSYMINTNGHIARLKSNDLPNSILLDTERYINQLLSEEQTKLELNQYISLKLTTKDIDLQTEMPVLYDKLQKHATELALKYPTYKNEFFKLFVLLTTQYTYLYILEALQEKKS